jgi:hypothetical protein
MSAVDFWKINLQSVFSFLTFYTAEVEWSKRNRQKNSDQWGVMSSAEIDRKDAPARGATTCLSLCAGCKQE